MRCRRRTTAAWSSGEKYFVDTLLDFDLASNNGGWQWAAAMELYKATPTA